MNEQQPTQQVEEQDTQQLTAAQLFAAALAAGTIQVVDDELLTAEVPADRAWGEVAASA